MKAITKSILDRFLNLAGDRLTGKWVIIGGTTLPLLGSEIRVTLDIDVAGPDTADQKELLVLMEIAEKLDLPPEAINQAGAYFLKKIAGWEDQIVLLHKGKKATIFRPNVTLFILLKLSRFSESDLTDCLEMLRIAKKIKEKPDVARVKKQIGLQLKEENNARKIERLKSFLKLLD